MVYPRGKPGPCFFPQSPHQNEMRTMGAIAGLLLLSLSGWLLLTGPPSKTRFLATPPETVPSALEKAIAIFQAGKYDEAEEIFSRGYQAAVRSRQPELAARFLWGRGNCFFARRQ